MTELAYQPGNGLLAVKWQRQIQAQDLLVLIIQRQGGLTERPALALSGVLREPL